MHLGCQRPSFFTSLSVVESCRCGCGDLLRRLYCCRTQRTTVGNRHYPSWNQPVAPAVAESYAPVAQSITLDAKCPSLCWARLQHSVHQGRPTDGMLPGWWGGPPGPRGTPSSRVSLGGSSAWASASRPTRASAADQGVRPTIY